MRGRRPPIEEWQRHFLLTGELPPDDAPDYNPIEGLDWRDPVDAKHDPARDAWRENGAALMKDWRKDDPGCQPYALRRYGDPEQMGSD